MSDHMNPWIGWASYDETSAEQGHKFVGRSAEISELFSLIDNNLLVTMYGKSGIGKTSLLNAGVFPSLRAADYIPVVCRCDPDETYPHSIIQQIKANCTISPDQDLAEYSNLVEFFRDCSFTNQGKSIFPILVFDQFEDWFRLNKDAVTKLLSDISYLISGEYGGLTNYRFIISIREDYLYLLEDAIDNNQSFDLKQNRYRLTNLNASQVEEIMDLGHIDRSVRNRLREISKDNAGYSPALLSFFCHELYEIYHGNISARALAVLKDESSLIEKYYNRCFDKPKISKSTREYIEKNLQDEGLRSPQNLKNVLRHIPSQELEILLNGENRLLQKFPVGEEEHIELLHDRLADIIHRRQKKEIENLRVRSIAGSLIIYLMLVAGVVMVLFSDLLHLSWVIEAKEHIELYFQSHRAGFHHDESIYLQCFVICSEILAVSCLIGILLIVIPRCICKFFYRTLTFQNVFVLILRCGCLLFLSFASDIFIFMENFEIVTFLILVWLCFFLAFPIVRFMSCFISATQKV